jgi:hypothetical protein
VVGKKKHTTAPGTLYVDETNGRKLFARKALVGQDRKSPAVPEQLEQVVTWLLEEWLPHARSNVYVEYAIWPGEENRVAVAFTQYNPTDLEDWFYSSSEKDALLLSRFCFKMSDFLRQFFPSGEMDKRPLRLWFNDTEAIALEEK